MSRPRLLVRLSMAMLLLCARALPQEPAPGGMLRSYLQGIALQQLASRKERVSEILTPEQFEKRKAEVRHLLLTLMGGLPEKRADLKVQKMGTIGRGDYRIEKIIYQSLPNFYVTANLYVPQSGKPPYPAVLQPTGHSLAAKARASYQTLSLGLVKNGFVVLTYDPLGQGERRIYYDAGLGDSKVGGATMEHDMAGIQSLLAGESIARYMIWDGMRGIDVLQSLLYVDPKRVGISGCSGGGTLTAYLAALDDRLQVAAPFLLYHRLGGSALGHRAAGRRAAIPGSVQKRAEPRRLGGGVCSQTVSHMFHQRRLLPYRGVTQNVSGEPSHLLSSGRGRENLDVLRFRPPRHDPTAT